MAQAKKTESPKTNQSGQSLKGNQSSQALPEGEESRETDSAAFQQDR